MGVDILLGATNQEVLDESKQIRARSHDLSRTFGYFMSRQSVADGEPELDQIGRLMGINIAPLYEMKNYVLEEDLQSELEWLDEEEQQELIQQVETNRASMEGNIDRVRLTVEALLDKLSTVDNLPELLTANGHDTLNHEVYFSNFNSERESSYMNNNFGQDFRNFKSFLDYAKSHGTTTVFFVYG